MTILSDDENSYFSYRKFENTGPGAEFGNFALAKLANEHRAGVLEFAVGDVTFSYCKHFWKKFRQKTI